MNSRPDLLTREEAALYLRVSRRWLGRHTPAKGGPPYIKLGRQPLYLKTDLDAWLQSRRNTGTQLQESSCPSLVPSAVPSASESRSTSASARRSGGSTSTRKPDGSVGALANEIADKLRRKHGSSTPKPSPKLVALSGGRKTTSQPSLGST